MGIRVLLVEDEREIGDFVARGLREEGFAVEWAADGDAGWHHLTTAGWDVVLLDWWLPRPAPAGPAEAPTASLDGAGARRG